MHEEEKIIYSIRVKIREFDVGKKEGEARLIVTDSENGDCSFINFGATKEELVDMAYFILDVLEYE